ncbi:hypothetical protein [Dielma fastidiosa]|jgi:hypothetical protein|uniref:hypothetical protein n=1 Tax=Dielma fastidiosa TaxID=1034346 RepID=UPI000D7A8665|nr:hypothetical protein [Dielma fastidiosa]MBS6168596.1 hypothetical protein [Bacillota bacterium]PWM54044.1 MAG: hypothetical protein DBX92_14585 [Dielma fastidiosa]RHN01473.1 hypothetical protein DWZ33_05630 [Dielma fastidiosa]DAK73389.1 MAG TPA: hypothetical protein [Caudoviricetes sp.]
MASIQLLNQDVIVLDILDGKGNKVDEFEFDPFDAEFAANFYDFLNELHKKDQVIKGKVQALTKQDKTANSFGLSKANELYFKENLELVNFVRAKFDLLFGAGTCERLFGKSKNAVLYIDFIEQLTPYFDKAREKKVSKYTQAEETEGLN